MKFRVVAGLAAVAALGVTSSAGAAPSPYKVTGGGQILAAGSTSSGVQGPGSTITFQGFIANQGESPATGQVNIIDRSASDTGQGVHYKGDVTCAYLISGDEGGGYVELRGTGQTKGGATTPFSVRIVDNGQGAAADDDQVQFDTNADDATCDEDNSDQEFEFSLARGNAKIHKVNSGASSSSSSKKPAAKKTATSKSLSTGSSLAKLVSLI